MQTARSYLTNLGLAEAQIDNVYYLMGFKKKEPVKDISIQIDLVIKLIVDYFGHTIENVNSASRRREYSECRFIIFYILYKYKMGKTTSIGNLFNRDHSTVINGLKTLKNLSETNEIIKNDIGNIEIKVQELIKQLDL